MLDKDFFKEIWQAITQNKMRSTLTAFGVFWGIFMLVTLSGTGNGLKNGIESQFNGFATNAAFMWTRKTTVPYKGYKKGRSWHLNNEDMDAIISQAKGIEYLVPRLQAYKQNTQNNTTYNNKYGTFTLNGDYPNLAKIEPFKMTKGRFLNKIDIRDKRKVCVIGPRVEETLYKSDENPLGTYIRISDVYFQVIGVFDVNNNMSMGYDKRTAIHIPLTTLQSTFNYGDQIHFFSFTAHPNLSVNKIEKDIIEILKLRNDISPDDNQAIGHLNIEKQFMMVKNLFSGINILTLIVGLGTLLAGIIGISNIMLIIVKERTREIGVKRAIGATPKNIIIQIMAESVLLTTSAGYIGLLLGILINEGLGAATAGGDNIILNPGINLSTSLKALLILVIAGALAGLLPASRAVKIKPIDALRDE